MKPVQFLCLFLGFWIMSTSFCLADNSQGHWGSWSQADSCSVTCGTGVRTVIRHWIHGSNDLGRGKSFTSSKVFTCINEDSPQCPTSWENGRLRFEMHPEMFQAGHKNITLTCSVEADGPINGLQKLQIQKLSLMSAWIDLATLKHDGSLESTLGQAVATGYMGTGLQSYVKITWPWASLQILGKYRCDAFGLTENEGENRRTTVLLVGGRAESSSASSPPDQGSPVVKGLKEMLSNVINSSFASLSSKLDSRFETLQSEKCGAVSNNKAEESTMWPEGNFALPMPESGCPLDPPAWDKGFKKMNAGNGDAEPNHGPYSLPQHLQILKTKDGTVYQQFCSMPSSSARKQPWPAGSYCINYLKKFCPAGFHSSWMNPGHTGIRTGTSGKKSNDDKYELYSSPGVAFCCRHDGDPNSAITLPVSKSFYLYRHQGTCQKVRGMEVVQDSLMVETGVNGKINLTNLFSSQGAAYRPDLSVSPLKNELCYYFNSEQEEQGTPDLDGMTNLNVILKKESRARNNNLVYIDEKEVHKSTERPQLDLGTQLPITISNPKVPLAMLVEGLMVPGRSILVSGMPTDNTQRFYTSFGDSEMNFLAMYIDFNIYQNNVIASYRDSCKWTANRKVDFSPFEAGQNFTMLITMEYDRFKVSVDGSPVIESMIRPAMKQSWLTHFFIDGAVKLHLVKVY